MCRSDPCRSSSLFAVLGVVGSLALASVSAAQAGTVLSEQKISETAGGFGGVLDATDEFGWHAVQDKVHVHDLHATILHIMGFDHERLTYRHGGRDYRLTDVHGHVVRQILAV